MSLTREIEKSNFRDVHSSSYTIYPDNEIPLDDFLYECKKLDFYDHAPERGDGWQSVTVFGIGADKTDHPSKYGIENPQNFWCLRDRAPTISNYFFSGSFFKDMEFKRIRIMRLKPNGLIRSHSDQNNNSLLNAINIELGPKPASFMVASKKGRISLNNYPGRTYLFNNHFQHWVYNKHDEYRYQIIVHAHNISEMTDRFIRSREPFIRGVWTDDEKRDYFAVWYASGKSKGAGNEGLPYIRRNIDDLITISKTENKKGLFINGSMRDNLWIGEKDLYDYFKKWQAEDLPSIIEEEFIFLNPNYDHAYKTSEKNVFIRKHKGLNLSVNYSSELNKGKLWKLDRYKSAPLYWTYSTDSTCDYESPYHKNRDFDLIISPATGTYSEFLMSSFNCNNALIYDFSEKHIKVFDKIRRALKLEKRKDGWELLEKTTAKYCNQFELDVKCDPANQNQVLNFMQYVNPMEYYYRIDKGNYSLLQMDIVTNPEKLLPYVQDKRIVINTSNIFSYINVIQSLSYDQIQDGWNRLMEVLKQSEYTYFIGEDIYKVNKRLWLGKDK